MIATDSRPTREDILSANPLDSFWEQNGWPLRGEGVQQQSSRCPRTEHKPTHLCVTVNPGLGVWHCHDCAEGGSVIDAVMFRDGVSIGPAMQTLSEGLAGLPSSRATEAPRKPPTEKAGTTPTKAVLVKTYDYHTATGELAYQVCRYEPKTFRQRHKGPAGEWVYSMEGIERVLYNLPALKAADFVWVVEGEKDADTLNAMGLVATCNVGGAGKWNEGYSESLRGKDIIICGDNDEAGRKHVELLQKETQRTVKTARIIVVPDEFKDVTDYVSSFTKKSDAIDAIINLAQQSEALVRGIRVPIRTMEELEREYRDFAQKRDLVSLDLGAWLPSFRTHKVRPLVPGELMVFVADTGVGKTMLMQNLSLHTKLQTLFFEMELPNTLMFERYAAMATDNSGRHVFDSYAFGNSVNWRDNGKLNHITVCPESKVTPDDIERIINQAGLKLGCRPRLVLVDYVQLIRGKGSRYERTSDVAEQLKTVAKSTNTIVVIASQVARKKEDKDNEIFLHDAKDSGSIENSAGLVIGAWRNPDDKFQLWLKVMKNTKGMSGDKVACRIREGSMLIREEAQQPE